MTSPALRTKSLRRRLFGSHLVVMFVALGVLAVVIGLVQLLSGGQAIDSGRRNDGGPVPLLIGISAAATAAGIVSWRMTRRLAEPLEAASAATRELAAGRYDVRLPPADTLELNALADSVNQLALELETTEHRRLRLIGDVAHELRNPLSTIEGTMEALLDGVVEADDETYSRVGRQAARLRRLADDLSSLSAAGESTLLNRESVDVGSIARDVVAQLEPQAAAKNLALSLEATKVPTLVGDSDRLTQVLMNVVGNAVQYTEEGSVVVSVGESDGMAQIDVADTGRGLAAEDQQQIFERFHRVDEHFADGTGVGLAIAKLIVDVHGGTIKASSPGLGKGTTVTIAIPIADLGHR